MSPPSLDRSGGWITVTQATVDQDPPTAGCLHRAESGGIAFRTRTAEADNRLLGARSSAGNDGTGWIADFPDRPAGAQLLYSHESNRITTFSSGAPAAAKQGRSAERRRLSTKRPCCEASARSDYGQADERPLQSAGARLRR